MFKINSEKVQIQIICFLLDRKNSKYYNFTSTEVTHEHIKKSP
jgi:hypothetical protein